MLPKKQGREYGLFVHGNRIISQLCFSEIDIKDLEKLNFNPNKSIIEEIVCRQINNIQKQLEIYYKDNILGTLFKNTTKYKHIVDLIIKD